MPTERFHFATIYFNVMDSIGSSLIERKIINHPNRVDLDSMADLIKIQAETGEIKPRTVRNFLRAHGNFFDDQVSKTVKNSKPVTSAEPTVMSVFEYEKVTYESRKVLQDFNSIRFAFGTPFILRSNRNSTAEKIINFLYGEEYNLEKFAIEFPKAAKSFQKLMKV